MGVCATRDWKTFGRLVQELYVCIAQLCFFLGEADDGMKSMHRLAIKVYVSLFRPQYLFYKSSSHSITCR